MAHELEVRLHGRLVGTITNLASDYNAFAFAESYLADEHRPTVSLGFYDVDGNIALPVRVPRVRLLPFFANLLPEGHLRAYLAQKAHVNAKRDFPLLWLLGEDLPGAAIVSHRDGVAITSRDAAELALERAEADPQILKFSLAGVQLKFSAIAEASAGLTIPAHGRDGDWLVKMPSATYDKVPENEFAMLAFARAVGIDVPQTRLIDSARIANMPTGVRTDLGRALAVKRFDRTEHGRIHIEDFNQIYNQYPHDKYDNVSYDNMLANIWATLGEVEACEFVRRLVFSIGIGNADMHLKNWSVIYRDGKTPTLAPAYDYVSTLAYIPNDSLALSLGRTKAWNAVTFDHLERVARHAKVPRGVVRQAANEMVARMRDVWPKLRGDLDVPRHIAETVSTQIAVVPLFSGKVSAPSAAVASRERSEIS